MNLPDWLWQELVGEAIWKAIVIGSPIIAGWAWKKREELAQRLRSPRHITRTVTDKLGITDAVTPTAGIQAQILYDVYGLAGAERQIRYN